MEKLIENDILYKYYQLYDAKDYKNFLCNYSYNCIINHFIEYGIYQYDDGRLPNADEINKEFEKIILEIKNTELKVKLIPLILFLDKEYWNHLLEVNYFNDIYLILLDDFKSLFIKINFEQINKFSYKYEINQNIIIDIEQRNFQTIIDFNIKQNMCNNQYNHFIYFIASKFCFDEYCQALDKKDDFTFLYFMSSLEYGQQDGFEKRLKILKNLDDKILLRIKLLNDILIYGSNEDFIFKTINFFSLNLNIWSNFLNYYLAQPSRNPQLFLPLSEVLNQSQYDVIDIFIDTVKINQYFYEDAKQALNNSILEIKNDEIQKYIMEKLFIRWKSFINNYEDYMGNLFLTDVIDIVIVFVRDFLQQDIVEKEIKQLIFNIEEIDNKWFKNTSEQGNYLYKQLSKLFVYVFALEKYDLFDSKDKIKYLLQNIENNLRNESVHKTKSTLQLFNEYILKERK